MIVGPDRKSQSESRLHELRTYRAKLQRQDENERRLDTAILLVEIVVVSIGLIVIAWWLLAR